MPSLYYLDSRDSVTGSPSDDTFNFVSPISGTFKLIRQFMRAGTQVGWIWDGVNQFRFRTGTGDDVTYHTFNVVIPVTNIQYSSDKTAIATILQNTINNAFSAMVNETLQLLFSRSCTVVYNSSADTWTMTFSGGPIDIYWSNEDSTINEPLGKKVNTEEIDENGTVFVLSAKYATSPDYYELYIAESPSHLNTTHETFPTMIFNITEDEFLDQYFDIPSATSNLHYELYRPNISLEPVPTDCHWVIAFRSV